MSSVLRHDHVFNNEIPLCDVHTKESKQAIEQLFLKHRISYYLEWKKFGFFKNLLRSLFGKKGDVYTVKINRAEILKAVTIIQSAGVDDIVFSEYVEVKDNADKQAKDNASSK